MKRIAIILITSLLLVPAAPILSGNTTTDKTTVVADAAQRTLRVRMRFSTDIHTSPTYNSPVIGHVNAGQWVKVYAKVTNNFSNLTSGGWIETNAIDAKG